MYKMSKSESMIYNNAIKVCEDNNYNEDTWMNYIFDACGNDICSAKNIILHVEYYLEYLDVDR